jgi:transposase-like protein
MRKPELKRITAALRDLTPEQRKIVAVELAALDAQPASTVIIEGRFANGATCPHCKSEHVTRHGHTSGLQRYRCQACSKTFTALTGTPLNRLHKRGKWLDQAQALQDGRTLRDVACTLNIHLSTAHRWRHRFLALPKAIQPKALTGIAEADETMFLLSFKGKRSGLGRKARKRGGKAAQRGLSHEQVPVLVARDRAGVTMDCVLKAMDNPSLTPRPTFP